MSTTERKELKIIKERLRKELIRKRREVKRAMNEYNQLTEKYIKVEAKLFKPLVLD